jgi:hypothetical protein
MGKVWKAHEIQYIEHVVVWERIRVEGKIDQRFDWDFDNCQSHKVLTGGIRSKSSVLLDGSLQDGETTCIREVSISVHVSKTVNQTGLACQGDAKTRPH